MLYALKSHEEGLPQISAEDAFSKLKGILDWGESQRTEGWICPYCRNPVFLKGSHVRHRQGSSSRVDAHFSHYSNSDAWLCVLFSPSDLRESSAALAQGVDHRQALSLFYSLPSPQDSVSWYNDAIRSEAFSVVELLDSLGISSLEEDDRPFVWPQRLRCLPQAPQELVARIKDEGFFQLGVRSFGLMHFEPLAQGALSVQGRPNAIRRFFFETGKERKEYFQRIASSGQLVEHSSLASQLSRSLIDDNGEKLVWSQGVTASLRLMALLLRDAVFSELKSALVIDVCTYIYLLPLVRPHKPRIEIVSHKTLAPKQRVVATEEKAQVPSASSVCKMRKALWIRNEALLAMSKNAMCLGPKNNSTQPSRARRSALDATYFVVPIPNGLFVTSDSLVEAYRFKLSRESNAFLLTKDQRLAKPSWHRLQELRPVEGGLRVDNRLLENFLCQEATVSGTHQWQGIEPGPKTFDMIDVGIIIRIYERRKWGGW
jgi:hypothetical protein